MAGTSSEWGSLVKINAYNPTKETVQSLRKRINPFRPNYYRVAVTDDIASVCVNAKVMEDYVAEYQSFLVNDKWQFKLRSSTRLDMDKAWIRPTKLEFWSIEDSHNIGRTYAFRFEDCLPHELPKIQIGSVGEMLGLRHTFRDGDLCYCFQEEPGCLMVYELFYLTTIQGRSGFVTYGTHKWVPHDLADWKATINNLVGLHYFKEQPGSMKVYKP